MKHVEGRFREIAGKATTSAALVEAIEKVEAERDALIRRRQAVEVRLKATEDVDLRRAIKIEFHEFALPIADAESLLGGLKARLADVRRDEDFVRRGGVPYGVTDWEG